MEELKENVMEKLAKEAVPEVILMAITPDGEDVIERACRTCYLSFHRYNPPASTEDLIKKVIRKGHHSVLEHASATFRIKGGSRTFTHEFVRHRVASPSQESQRYVEYGVRKQFEVVVPESMKENGFAEKYLELAKETHELYEQMLEAGVPKEDARYILPGGITSEIVMTANFREWRHICKIRCHERAHWEIRRICLEILKILKKEAPIVFWDFEIDEENCTARQVSD
ncbi:MAG: FAD-dependent thymidylate synthase [candidate division Zixibacteria bacterium]|jgi:thymidylate synthase (FAD)|nr:FAD-dependent thymidylate synthase [candidate division Zixibacteria bacterium]NIR63545.1 FAD-dependent thymidylate synthase [candidate division Zixibacteria bacterium]NIS18036.1 FAD-dependent thymidylate synthase [candidate division Zixibacteria bacterium]NIS45491.1 FAD-dependent thymidylate synthase [candidate division Zixibacteria bacterium]NIT54316.1 FAD-dependent thymidylate synthase [candidate division Zixibacteria bacterium]